MLGDRGNIDSLPPAYWIRSRSDAWRVLIAVLMGLWILAASLFKFPGLLDFLLYSAGAYALFCVARWVISERRFKRAAREFMRELEDG